MKPVIVFVAGAVALQACSASSPAGQSWSSDNGGGSGSGSSSGAGSSGTSSSSGSSGGTKSGSSSSGGSGQGTGSADAGGPVPGACAAGAKTGNPMGGTLMAAGVNVVVRTPPGYDATKGYPFVMVYAPAGAMATDSESFTMLTPEAQQRGYVIAYADNISASGGPSAVQQASTTIPAVTDKWCIDPKRVYATGHSDGGTVTEAIGAYGYATLAAIAPSATGIDSPTFMQIGCPKAPLPVMDMHSSGDDLFPISMAFGADVAKDWAQCDKCGSTPSMPDSNNCVRYTGCASGVEVQYCQGSAPHPTWPGLNTAIFDFFGRFTAR